MRKKVDERIRTLIENGVKLRHRSMFVIIGDKSRDQIVNLHYMQGKAGFQSRPSVLWCYKDKLELSSHKKKRVKQVKKLMQRGLLDPEKVDPFSLFLETAGLTHCLYKDSERILGNTFGMCILQDFEALTPNLLARTIETVQGGGLIILLLRSLSSLTSLCTMVMDVHERFRTESHLEAAGRFNERFLLSLASCKACVVMDDELNILPISSHIRSIITFPSKQDFEGLSEAERDLKNLKEQLNDDFPVGPLIKKCCTLDQGKAVITFLDAILDKTLRSTTALLAARGRGKSAALGLAVAGAVAAGYSNVYVTAPSPENLKTLFEFICKGLDELEFKEHLDYDIVRSVNPEFKKAIVRINIYKHHRQTIQYIQPQEHEKLSQVELLVIDEAAAIPLPIVKSLLGPYLVFLSSTVNGYEGTGRSLSLKLLQQLEEQSQMASKNSEGSLSGRLFRKIELSESIRYSSCDPIESWLNGLLCLDVANHIPNISRLPPPAECDLYYVNRDTLFSYHKDSELFLQRMMALYVSSHYKNSPNDLQLMADAPAHHLFVLLGPVDESKNQLPDILCVIQSIASMGPKIHHSLALDCDGLKQKASLNCPNFFCCEVTDSCCNSTFGSIGNGLSIQGVSLEGQISRKSAMKSLSGGHQPSGDQIPWKFCEQFRDTEFPSLSGARIVRIATHPSAMRLGYGSAAVELLTRYFEGQLTPISEVEFENDAEIPPVRVVEAAQKVSLLEETIKPRANLPHLLVNLRERRPEKLHYLGVSFGLTLDLFRFWRKLKFAPFYIAQNPNTVTGEHTCMVLKPLNNDDLEVSGTDEWGFFSPFYQEFKIEFARLLQHDFRTMEYKLAMSVLDPKINYADAEAETKLSVPEGFWRSLGITPCNMNKLKAYTENLADYRSIKSVVSILARAYFEGKIPITLSYVQASILLCLGMQCQEISYIEEQMKLERSQILSLYLKIMKKLYKYLLSTSSSEFEAEVPRLDEQMLEPHGISVEEDLKEAAKQVEDGMRAKAEGMLDPELLQQYAIVDKDGEIDKALKNGGDITPGGVISVKSSRAKPEKHERQESHKSGKKRKGESGSKSHKKRKP